MFISMKMGLTRGSNGRSLGGEGTQQRHSCRRHRCRGARDWIFVWEIQRATYSCSLYNNKSSGTNFRLSLNSLLVYLIDRVNTEADILSGCIIFWPACAFGSAAKTEEASADPFFFPRLVGPKGRPLKISAAFKRKVAQISATGNVFHSPDAVLRGFDILARSGGHPFVIISYNNYLIRMILISYAFFVRLFHAPFSYAFFISLFHLHHDQGLRPLRTAKTRKHRPNKFENSRELRLYGGRQSTLDLRLCRCLLVRPLQTAKAGKRRPNQFKNSRDLRLYGGRQSTLAIKVAAQNADA